MSQTEEVLLESLSGGAAEGGLELRHAKVVALFEDGTPQLQFAGEDVPSEAHYAFLASYFPTVEDSVVLLLWKRTYIILHAVAFGEVPPGIDLSGYATHEEVTEAVAAYDATASGKFADSNDVNTLQNDVSGMQSTVSGIQSTVSGIQSTVSGIQSTVSGIQSSLNNYVKKSSASVTDLASTATLSTVITRVNQLFFNLRLSGIIG